ncbi:MAG TPA: hypothetical protein VJ400_07790 [Thermoplasmata archaeon]|nr:hypothetical protein [Thermoplasmata archaeon]
MTTVAFLMIAVPAIAEPALAHSMTFGSQIFGTICLGGFSTTTWTVYNNAGPFDKTWNIRARIGLENGDNIQLVRWDVSLIDAAIFAEISNWREADFDWVQTGQYVYANTLSGHIGGGVTMTWFIYNNDPNAQCFLVFVQSAYE